MRAGATPNPDVVSAVWRESHAPITVVREFVGLIRESCDPWKGRPINRGTTEGDADFLMAMGFSRAVRTCLASIDLVALGFAEEAFMLTRSLYEGLLVAYWIDQNEAQAFRRFSESLKLTNHLTAEIVLDLRLDSTTASDHRLEPEELERLKKQYGRYGEKLWTEPNNAYSLAKKVGERLPEDERSALESIRRIPARMSNHTLHATPHSHLGTILGDGDDSYRFEFGPVSRGATSINPAIYAAFWYIGIHADLVYERFEFEGLDELKAARERGTLVFSTVYDDDAKTTGRNDPCPCGSGRKFKRCHDGRTKPRSN